jgi:hypothetical protein
VTPMLRFADEYIPRADEIPVEKFAQARAEVEADLRPLLPDVDFAPGTPTGDAIITPLAGGRAAADEAMSRLMSDLNLGNVSRGLIYSCNFVREYLGNFGVYDVENLSSVGVVRLTFSTPEPRSISRALRFRFGGSDDWRLRVHDPASATVQLMSAGSYTSEEPDRYIMAQTSPTSWAVDIPLEADMTQPVLRGAAATLNELLPGLTGAVAAVDFIPGVSKASLSDLATMTRRASYALSSGSRDSIRAAAFRNWPELQMVSPVINGDLEMQRAAAATALALQEPSVDIYVRSNRDMQLDEQVVKLQFVTPPTGPRVFRGRLALLQRPSLIESVTWSAERGEPTVASWRVFSRSTRPDLHGLLHCGSLYEELYIEIVPELDAFDNPKVALVSEVVGDETRLYAYFRVAYRADPLVGIVARTLESSANRLVGVSTVVKSGPLAFITKATISYVRRAGTRILTQAAKQRLSAYMRKAGYPAVPALADLHSIMRQAGAARVTSITLESVVSPTPASWVWEFSPTSPAIDGDWEDGAAEITPVEPGELPVSEIFDDPASAWAATARTLRYFLPETAVVFGETTA